MPALTLVQAINDALHTEMSRDDRVVILGKDLSLREQERILEAIESRWPTIERRKYGF
jgi:pyruvate/2-oxoglutarate/acetoin dehydrogenase E1 component